MVLTAGDEHIKHTLGRSMSSEISHMDVINAAGKWLTTVFPWRWLARRFATLDLEDGIGFVRLPSDVQEIIQLRHVDDYTMIELVGLDRIHNLRVIGESTYPWYGALTRRTLPPPNLLAYSDAFSQLPWTFSTGTGTVTANAAINPFTNKNTSDEIDTTDTSAVTELTQTVYPRLLSDATKYTFNAAMRPSPVTATTPNKSGIVLQTPSHASSGLRTLLEIQWGQTPWQDAPTATVISTNSGGGTSMTPVPVGEGFWHFAIQGYQHEMEENYGRLIAGIQPGRAQWSDASGTEDATDTGTVEVARAWLHEGIEPIAYNSTGATVQVPRRLDPVLEIAPTPSTTDANALSMLYRGGWVDAEDDGDELTLPGEGWMDVLFVETLRAFARGWEEQDQGELSQRLALVQAGPVFQAAVDTDALVQPNYGPPRNTGMDMARRYRGWQGDFPIGPITASPST